MSPLSLLPLPAAGTRTCTFIIHPVVFGEARSCYLNDYIYLIYLHLKIINHEFCSRRHKKAGCLSAPGSKNLFSQTCSVDHLLEALGDFLLSNPFSKGQFLDQQPAGELEDFFFTIGKLFPFLDQVQLSQNLGDVLWITGPDLVIVFALPPAP